MAGTKLQIVSGFVLFALLVAPFAYQLTQVERVELPASRIHALSWENSRFATPSRHVVQLWLVDSAADAASDVRSASSRIQYQVNKLSLSAADREALRGAASADQVDETLLRVLPTTNDFSVVFLCDPTALKDAQDDALAVVGKHRHAFSRACSPSDKAVFAAIEHLVQTHVFPKERPPTERDTRRARVAVRYRLQFTLLKEHADQAWTWDFEALQQRYLAPVLEKLHSIADFSVEHQVVHFARLAKDIHRNAEGNYSYINADDLKGFKSANDYLTSAVLADREQVLHFMAALPDAAHTPLRIKTNNNQNLASSFEIPGWGTVVVLDPSHLDSQFAHEELQRTVGLFISQLRTLLGLPSFFHRSRDNTNKHLTFLPSPRNGIAQWELDHVHETLLRRHVRTTIETLQSIVRLVSDMTQMTVLERVERRISTALALVEEVLCVNQAASHECASSFGADETATLLRKAGEAADNADAAYYDHTMIRQLYFPQEQMLGVFAPLLAPLLLPFVMGWIREFKRVRSKQKDKAKQE
ncbi:hypothetical protein Poli38472_001028 [Pythium oligandrum]|uniref:GPI transamidase component PIG-S n=1 Tax=Pythium oligandrum TaxID=41045 RepID=A0A8K1CS60_PYTOL|nr:hypothetical protein Poli38472_001028 [Pythium oligandrum]|eukprot:TMW68872.1 hypothetical protein Poli38472_001028 [Pythium oligandrum]